jgi:excinuclease UvrABC nuclease subunit
MLEGKIALDGTAPFRPSSLTSVPMRQGVYFIHDLRGTGYIGRSKHLRARFEYHLQHAWNPQLSHFLRTAIGPLYFSWIATEDSRGLERSLVRLLRPPANRIRYGMRAHRPPARFGHREP